MEMTELFTEQRPFTAYEKKTLTKELRTEFPLMFKPSKDKQKKVLRIVNKALVGDLYFTKYIDYIKWIRNALLITAGNHND